MNRRANILTTAAVVGASVILAACSGDDGSTTAAAGGDDQDTSTSLEDFTVVLDFLPNGEYGPLFAAVENGWYEEVGLNVTIERGSGSADTIKRIAAGQGDIGMADFSAVLGTRADENVEVKAVASYFQVPAHSFFYLEGSGIEEPADLAGRDIAISPGNSHQIIFPYFAEQAGFDPDSVTWVSMDGGAMGPALIQGQVDSAPFLAVHDTRLNLLADQAGQAIGHFAFADYGVDFSALSFVARDSSIDDPDESSAIRRFLEATVKGMEDVFVNGNYDVAADAVMQSNPELDPEAVVGAMETAARFAVTDEVSGGELAIGEFSPARVENTVTQYQKLLDITGDVAVEDLYTNELLPGN